ncbi:type IV secretory system conjugative DNA transfer family protein [Escherichia coli]|nr:type IV secretory system conjugative DNA transfer family protein [Escherichia coli]
MGRVTEDVPADLDVDTRVRYMGHVTTLAPSGSGKGIGAVTPTLLEYPGSTIVLDPKGELYATTARYRRDVLGHKIIACDPFGVLKGLGYDDVTYRLNWIDYIEPDSEDVTSQASLLADLLVLSEGNANESSVHFLETARTFLRGLLVHVATLEDPTKRNMGEVRRLLTCSEAEFKDLMIDMKLNKRGAELPVRAANSLLATPEKERGSILSTARRNLDFIDDQRIVRALEQSDFDLKKLKQEKMTVYVIMPPDRIETNKRYLRVMFGLAVHGVTKVAGKPDYRVLFLLDEFAQLGRMTVIENALPIIRGYGGVFWFILQNISQLKTNYPNNWESFIANSGAKQFFGTADYETAKYISDTLGKTTVEYQTNSSNSGSSFGQGMSVNSGDGTSQQFTGRDLMTADEVLKLPADQVIVMLSGKGEAPYLLNRITYYRDAEYAGRFDPNPYEN